MDMIGQRIRGERQNRRLTLEQLSRGTGFSKSFLSQVERGLTQPSVTSLKKIARYFGIGVVNLFDKNEAENQSNWGYNADTSKKDISGEHTYAKDITVVHAGRRKGITLPGSRVIYEILTPDLKRQLEVMYMRISKGDTSGDEPMIDPPGEKFGFVLSGTIEVTASGQVFELHGGDSICHPADVPHSWRGISGEPIEVIWVQTPPTF
jgi:transcriptional regulator with XRE-family HTH domain